MSFAYANPGSGPSAGGIGWFNFGNLSILPGQTISGLSGTLSDGTSVTFDLSAPASSAMNFNAFPSPLAGVFGYVGYTGILGNVLLQNDRIGSLSPGILKVSNIVVKDVDGNPVTNYVALVADGENTNIGESWNFVSDGGPWSLFTTIGNNPTTLTGLGTQSANIIGTNQAFTASYVLATSSPKTLDFTAITNSGLEAFALGFATTRVTLRKRIGSRINSADQFKLSIAGTPNDEATTLGASNGYQSEIATVYGIAGNTYTINETMAAGSVSTLSNYKVLVSGVNLTPGALTPPLSALPISVTPQLGDNILYTITNAAPQSFTKKVDKQYADKGDVLTYTITIHNPNDFAIANVFVSDATPTGTTYIGNLIVSAPYTGSSLASGITITSIDPYGSVTISWQVQVDTNVQLSNVNNVASISIPDGTSGNTNVVTTKINNADLTSNGNFIKSASLLNAKPGDVITYTISIKNTGNVAANNIVLTDVIPAGTSYVANSAISTLPFSGDPTTSVSFTAPLAAGASATFAFQVKIGNVVPTPNPIPNKADIKYTYTVDPANPNGVSKNGSSNTTSTNVVKASVLTTKMVDKTISYVGDVLTYNVVVKNNGNTPLDNVFMSDVLPNGTSYIPGSLSVSAPYSGTPATGITLTNALMPGSSVTLSFKVNVISMPNPNPIANVVNVAYKYTLNPTNPGGESGTSTSNAANTLVFKNNYQQQINDLIASVALEQAALAAIANAEGAKVQKALALGNITQQELLCINKSVQEMLDSISSLETILKQKLNQIDCQINGDSTC